MVLFTRSHGIDFATLKLVHQTNIKLIVLVLVNVAHHAAFFANQQSQLECIRSSSHSLNQCKQLFYTANSLDVCGMVFCYHVPRGNKIAEYDTLQQYMDQKEHGICLFR